MDEPVVNTFVPNLDKLIHTHRAVLQPFHPATRDQLPHQLRLVAQKSSPALISRTSYEVEVAVHVLNRMLDLGRPNSIRIA